MGPRVREQSRFALRWGAFLPLVLASALISGAAHGSVAPPEDATLGSQGNAHDSVAQSGQDDAQSGQDDSAQSGQSDLELGDEEEEKALAASLFATSDAPQPLQGDVGCSYADPGTGAYAQTLCWLNFEGFSHTSGTTNHPVSIP